MFVPASCNILPHAVKYNRQHFAFARGQHEGVKIPAYSAREVLATNVAALMSEHDDLNSAKKLAARCRWPATAGPKRRGKALSERYIRYVLNPTADSQHSPSLDVIQAIAEALDTQAWRLLVDEKAFRQWMVGKLFTTSEAVSDIKVEQHLPLPPDSTQRRPARK